MKFNKIVSLVVASMLIGCSTINNPSVISSSNYQGSEKVEIGTVKFLFGFPEKFVTKKTNSFGVKAFDTGKINRVKVKVESATTDFVIERDVELIPGGVEATLSLPLDKLYTVTVKGLNDMVEVSGSEIRGYFALTSAIETPIVQVNQTTTPVAKIIQGVKAKLKLDSENLSKSKTTTNKPSLTEKEVSSSPSPSPSSDVIATPEKVFRLKDIDTDALADVVKRARINTHPSLVNITPFIDAIINEKAAPVEVPPNALLKTGRIKGLITGLKHNEIALVTIGDPSSKPFIVSTSPLVSPSDETNPDPDTIAPDVEYSIDNITPGEWEVSVVAVGYAKDSKETKTNGKFKIESDKITSADFDLVQGQWPLAPNNLSGSIGKSDQADSALDPVNNIHLVWRQDGFETDLNSGVIFYSRWNGNSWTTQGVNVSQYNNSRITGSRSPSVASGVDRLPHVVWSGKDSSGNRKIFYNSSNGITWKTPIAITGSDSGISPSIAVDSTNGYLYSVWESNGDILFSQNNKSEWAAPVKVGTGFMPKIDMGSDGIAHIVWHASSSQKLQYVNWSLPNGLSSIETLPATPNGNDIENTIDTSVDRFNRFHVIWRNDSYVQYLLRSNASWSQPEIVNQISTTFSPAKNGAGISISPTGIVTVAWVSSLPNNKEVVRFRRRLSDGWKMPFSRITDPTEPTQIDSVDLNGGSTTTTTTTTTEEITEIKKSENIDGFEDIPLSQVTSVDGKPIVVADNTGNIHVIWSNRGSNSNDTDLLHSVKTVKSDKK